MSINRDMRSFSLERKKKSRTASGGEKHTWESSGTILVAVYKKSDLHISASEKYKESTHTGLTHYRNISSGEYRIIRDGIIYDIIDCNPEGRLTNLLLKVVS